MSESQDTRGITPETPPPGAWSQQAPFAQPPAMPTPPPPGMPAPSGPGRGTKMRPIIIAFSVIGLLAVLFIVFTVLGSEKEFGIYEKVEKSYQGKMQGLVGEGSELGKDPSAYVVKYKDRISAARREIAAAKSAVKALESSTDRTDYLSSLARVDAQLAILEQFGSATAGPEELAVAIEKAARPVSDADEALGEASDALRAKDYAAMIAQGKVATTKAAEAEPLLASLEEKAPGIGVADLKDAAAVIGDSGEAFAELGAAYKASDDSAIKSAEVRLSALSGKYQGAFKRAATSAAWALWASPGTALQDTLRALESAAATHAKVYQRIENGD